MTYSIRDFGAKPGDLHLVVNPDRTRVKIFGFDGKLVTQRMCLARGTGGRDWRQRGADTPPGLYISGELWNDYNLDADYSATLLQYGWYTIDLISLVEGELRTGRDGIAIHGGGSACGWPGAWYSYQELHPTRGCIRMHNKDIHDFLVPTLVRGHKLFTSVS